MKAKTQKRYYYSTFGHKKENIIQHITSGGSVPLVRDEPERYDFHNLIEWWKVKAQKRYEKLEFLGDIRKDIEIYTEDKLNKKLEELHGDMIR